MEEPLISIIEKPKENLMEEPLISILEKPTLVRASPVQLYSMFFTDDMSMSISGSSSDEMDDMDFDMDVPFDYLDIEEDVDMMTFHMVINDGVFTEDEEKLFVEGMKYENRIMIMRRKKEMKKEKIKRKLISAREKTKEERREDLVQRNIDKKKG